MNNHKMISFIIPSYNEESSIGHLLSELQKLLLDLHLPHEIIVVDDGSSDDTAKIAQKMGAVLLRHPTNMGYGTALKTGIRHSNGKYIFIMDADETYPVKQIPMLLQFKDDYDMVVGARIGKNVKTHFLRRLAKYFLTKLSNFLVETNIPDLNSGMRIFKRDTIKKFLKILPSGFSFTTTLTLAYLSHGYLVKYVPIDYYDRKGKSKIRPFKDTIGFMSLIIRTITYFNPLKIFLSFSLALFIMSIIVFSYSTFVLNKFMDVTTTILVVAAIQIALFGLIADLIVRRSNSE